MCTYLFRSLPPYDITRPLSKYAHVYVGRMLAKNMFESTANAILRPVKYVV